MDDIIAKLSEIESAASRVIEDAREQKVALDQMQTDRLEAYDRQAHAAVKKELADLQNTLSAERDRQLTHLQEEAARTLSQLNDYYSSHKSQLADEIFQSIIRK